MVVYSLIAEFRKPEHLPYYFPLLHTRSGRGSVFIFFSLPMFDTDPGSIILGIIVLILAIFNILIGWKDELTIKSPTQNQ